MSVSSQDPSASNPLEVFKSILSSEIKSLKQELLHNQDQAIEKAAKRFKPNHEFKSNGCKEQFQHEEKVFDKIEDALQAIEGSNLEAAKDFLNEGKDIISNRKKEIILADKHGWDFVQEYKKKELADDSGDEKRMRKALKTIENNRETKRKERSKKYFKRRDEQYASRNTSYSNYVGQSIQPFKSFSQHSNSACHHCGRFGHWWRSCPVLKSVSYGSSTSVPPAWSTTQGSGVTGSSSTMPTR